MPKYLIRASYTTEGAKGLLSEGGSGRRQAVDDVVATLDGVEAMYYAYGEDDLILIVDFPDYVSMAATSMAVKASGALHTKATPLLTIEDIDEAVAKKVPFRAPGG